MAETPLESIGFAEFTTNLILKIFDGLVAANLAQTEAYIHLVQTLSKTLSEFVSDSKSQISGTEVLQFLAPFLPKDETGLPIAIVDGGTLGADVSALNLALMLASGDGGATKGTDNSTTVADNKVAMTTAIATGGADILFDAVARRLAANKYSLLKEMVKQGLLRMVVPQGLIEARLTYTATTSSFLQSNAATYDSKQFNFAAQAQTGTALARWVKASASTSYTSVSVKTTNQTQQDYSGSVVNVFGLVRIEFKTDYLPLSV